MEINLKDRIKGCFYPTDVTKKIKTAVCVLFEKDGEFLSVSRKDNQTDFGLPGGKLNPGETLIECAQRELMEETGYNLRIVPWNPFMKVDSTNTFVITFKAEKFGDDSLNTISEIDTTKETGVVSFIHRKQLCRGTFKQYNKEMFKHFGYE